MSILIQIVGNTFMFSWARFSELRYGYFFYNIYYMIGWIDNIHIFLFHVAFFYGGIFWCMYIYMYTCGITHMHGYTHVLQSLAAVEAGCLFGQIDITGYVIFRRVVDVNTNKKFLAASRLQLFGIVVDLFICIKTKEIPTCMGVNFSQHQKYWIPITSKSEELQSDHVFGENLIASGLTTDGTPRWRFFFITQTL
ncbi:hypothetical protein ACJX0J_030453, partial [Zea mays]